MRHKKRHTKINRFTSWRKATIKSLMRSLLIYQNIHTTKAKAKLVQPYIDRLIHSAKTDSLTARRNAFAVLGDHLLVKRLFDKIAPLFQKRQSGFTRVISLGARRGDGANVCLFELTEKIALPKPEKTGKKVSSAKLPRPAAEQIMDAEIKETPEPRAEKAETGDKKKKEPTGWRKKDSPTSGKEAKEDKTFLKGIKKIFKKDKVKDSE